jgi:hypothetical protein
MEEILVPVACQDEAESFVADQPLDRAVHWCHCSLLEIHRIANALQQDVIAWEMPNACPKTGRRWMNAGWFA